MVHVVPHPSAPPQPVKGSAVRAEGGMGKLGAVAHPPPKCQLGGHCEQSTSVQNYLSPCTDGVKQKVAHHTRELITTLRLHDTLGVDLMIDEVGFDSLGSSTGGIDLRRSKFVLSKTAGLPDSQGKLSNWRGTLQKLTARSKLSKQLSDRFFPTSSATQAQWAPNSSDTACPTTARTTCVRAVRFLQWEFAELANLSTQLQGVNESGSKNDLNQDCKAARFPREVIQLA
ncbi:hypothetical protein PSTG_07309 [Puccinia striiformis f. sp. tritici PST-78]|uniref:Uncharacterized protein n=1 Tax=Puccinia striiformis f. sp. tritici PST-78 TaxID=1165861 RepID=A0A0L0VJB5_9BASI|nr:hypothetical protein PSTG_07309 [Puccinia striiformis f. sp. tritici PST-78]